jgi:hypothetical protein
MLIATDWATISSLVTGAGTLVLAIATFAAVRSSNRSARIAEAALQEQRRPVLAPSRFDDPLQKIMFVEGHWIKAEGGRGAAEHIDGVVFLGISLRNVGSGMAVCQGWSIRPGPVTSNALTSHAAVEEFRLQTRDLYVPAGDVGMWQGALRDPEGELRAAVAKAIDARETLSIELLYTDQVGGQRTITRFGLFPTGDTWLASVNRHWYLDWSGPRPDSLVEAASERVLREREAAERRMAERADAGSSDGERDRDGAVSRDASPPADQGRPAGPPPGTRVVQPTAPSPDG